jgi:hypothetical protein
VVGSFFNPICYSISLIGALKPFTFSVKIEKYLLFLVIFIPLLFSFTYSLFTGLLAQKGLFFVEASCLTLVSSSICKNPLSIFCIAALVVANSFSLFFLVVEDFNFSYN